MSILLSVESKNSDACRSKLCILQLIDLERVEKSLSVADADHLGHLLDELFDARVVLSKSFI